MDDDGAGRRWQEPSAGVSAVLLRSGGLGLCFVLAATSVVSENWDGAVVAAVIAFALAWDLWRDLRPRQLMLAGPDLLVIRTARRTTVVPWGDIDRVDRRGRGPGAGRPVLVRRDGSSVDLPRGAPAQDVKRWIHESRDQG